MVLTVDGLGSIRGVGGFVECGEGFVEDAGEAARDAVLRVELDTCARNTLESGISYTMEDGHTLLQRTIANNVSMAQILGQNRSPWLIFLSQVLVGAKIRRICISRGNMAACNLVERVCGFDFDWIGAELGAVEEESGFCSGLALVGDGCGEGGVGGARGGGDDQVGDFAAEREEVTDLFFRSRVGDVGDMDGLGVRHSCGCECRCFMLGLQKK